MPLNKETKPNVTVVVFFLNQFALWILSTLNSLPGIFKFNIQFLNILLFILIGIIPYTVFTGLNNILLYIYITLLGMTLNASSNDGWGE